MFLFCSAFHRAPLILNVSFGGGGGVVEFIHLLVPSSSCGFVLDSISECFSVLSVLFWGSPHVTDCQGDFTHNRKTGSKQAQDPPGSLHTIVSPVE